MHFEKKLIGRCGPIVFEIFILEIKAVIRMSNNTSMQMPQEIIEKNVKQGPPGLLYSELCTNG